MTTQFALELLGYSGSVLIALSLMMSSILRLRMISTAGSALFSLYGLLIGAVPVAVLNGFIVLVNVYHLRRLLRGREYLQLLPLQPESEYLRNFLSFYRDEISRVLPEFDYEPAAKQVTLFILRDCNPVGVFIANEEAPGRLRVRLDFVVPRYRDLRIGQFVFVEQAQFFRARGIQEVVIAPRVAEFGAYLVKVGFRPAGGDSLRFRFEDEAAARGPAV